MSTVGLLEKAESLRSQKIEMPPMEEESSGLDGISADDRREIQAQIEKITLGSRQELGKTQAVFKAQRSGVFLPLGINIALLIVGIASVLGFYISTKGQNDIRFGSAANFSSAEGRLIQELKRISEVELSRRDSDIENLKGILDDLDDQRRNLALDYEQRLSLREAELEETLTARLAIRETELRSAGLSQAEMDAELSALRAQLNSDQSNEIEEFRVSLEAERAASEAKLEQMSGQLRSELAAANAERQKILTDAAAREAALRSELERTVNASREESTQRESELSSAMERLSNLATQQERLKAVDQQIAGMYLRIQDAIQGREYAQAASLSDSLLGILNERSVLELTQDTTRRNADLYIASFLKQSALSELSRAESDGQRVLAQNEMLDSLRSLRQQADSKLEAGDIEGAALEYDRMLSVLPDILRASEFFREREAARVQETGQRIQEAGDSALAMYEGGRYEEASVLFGELLLLAGTTASVRDFLSAAVQRQGSAAQARSTDTRLAASAIVQAKRLASQDKWPEAIRAWIAILASRPSADQVPEILEALRGNVQSWKAEQDSSAAAIEASLASERRELTSQISALREENTELRRELNAVEKDANAELAASVETREQRITELEQRVSSQSEKISELEAQLLVAVEKERKASEALAAIPQVSERPSPPPDPLDGSRAVNVTAIELENLKRAAADGKAWENLLAAWKRFSQAEQSLRTSAEAGVELRVRSELDRFLTITEAQRALPGFASVIERMEEDVQRAASDERLKNAASVAEASLRLSDAQSRARYLQDMQRRYINDVAMQEFISRLQAVN